MANVTAKQVIAKAKTYLGMDGTTFRTAYYGYNNSDAWCVMFVWYVFQQLNASSLFCGGDKTAYVGYVCSKYQEMGRFYSTPQVGDLVLFNWLDGGDIYDHIAIVTSVESSTIHTIEGNTDNGIVAEKVRSRNNTIIGYCRPAYATSSVNGLSYGDTGSEVVSMQRRLMMTGYSCGDAGADGEFGDQTLAALKKYQKVKGLTVTGVYDTTTKAKLAADFKALGVYKATAKISVAVRTGPSADTARLSTYPEVKKGEIIRVAKTVQVDNIRWHFALLNKRYVGYVAARYFEKNES